MIKLILLCLIFINSSNAFSTKIGFYLNRNKIVDHVHVTVGEGYNARSLNVWADCSGPETSECFYGINKAYIDSEKSWSHKYIEFESSKTEEEIISKWKAFFDEIRHHRSLVGKNCAYASKHFFEKILEMKFHNGFEWSRLIFFIKAPKLKGFGIQVGEDILARLKKYLIVHDIEFSSK